MKFLKGNARPLTTEDRCAAARLNALADRAKAARGSDWLDQEPAEQPDSPEPLEVRDILQ